MSTTAEPAVLHFAADWLPPSEVFVHDLVGHLRHRAVVVAGNRPQNVERFGVVELHTLADLYRFVRLRRLRPAATTLALDALAARRGIGLVHVHHGYQVERVLGLVARRGLPLVLSLHGHDVTGYLQERPDAYAGARRLVAAVVVPSRFLAGLAIEAGFDPAGVRVLPSGVDTAAFVPAPLPEGPPVALFVGRFVAKKGLDVLARAWPLVRAQLPAAELRLLGYGPLEPLARSIEGAAVTLAPDPAEVRRAMGRCTAVVTPSHLAAGDAVESLLMVNVEAQAAGRAVVTTRHGGIPEYVAEGRSALVVPEGNAPALAAALVQVLGDRALATRLGAAGPAVAAPLDVRRTAAAVDRLYDELLTGAAVPHVGAPGPARRGPVPPGRVTVPSSR